MASKEFLKKFDGGVFKVNNKRWPVLASRDEVVRVGGGGSSNKIT